MLGVMSEPSSEAAQVTEPGPGDTAASATRRHLMENEVLEHATRLFAERGFAGTTLQDVAESMGLKRPALYYYFKSKEALLDRLISEATTSPAQDLAAIGRRTDQDATERLHAMACHMVTWVATHTDRFLLLVKSESDLSPEAAALFNSGRRAALDTVTAVIDEGIAAGQFRAVDSHVASLGVWGICNWVAWWFRSDGARSIDSVANQLADMAVASLQKPGDQTRRALSPAEALTAVRDDLDRLEQVLGSGTPKGRPTPGS